MVSTVVGLSHELSNLRAALVRIPRLVSEQISPSIRESMEELATPSTTAVARGRTPYRSSSSQARSDMQGSTEDGTASSPDVEMKDAGVQKQGAKRKSEQ